MPIVNYATREITSKIVYYGAARSGKTTNLQFIHSTVPPAHRGPIVSLSTEGDRTLFFDYLPVELGTISGYRTRIQLFTVPGQVYYDSTRRLVLQGADGVVFVVDSRRERHTENVESFRNLQSSLLDQGVDPRAIPLCLQYNKRDLPNIASLDELNTAFNFRTLTSVEAAAVEGTGVFETLKAISSLVLDRIAVSFDSRSGTAGVTHV